MQATFAGTRGGNTLVVLSLRGGIDGLGVVVPHGDPGYYQVRPTTAVAKTALLCADSMFGLHPRMAPLAKYWNSGQLAAVQTNPTLATAMDLSPAVALRGVVLFCGLYDMRTVAGTGFPALRTYLWSYTGARAWTSFRDIDQRDIGFVIRVEISHCQVGWCDTRRDRELRLKSSVSASQKDPDILVSGIRNGEIGDSITVEVTNKEVYLIRC